MRWQLSNSVEDTNGSETNGQTPGIDFGAFQPKNSTSGGNDFNDFPDNQLTKFRVFVD